MKVQCHLIVLISSSRVLQSRLLTVVLICIARSLWLGWSLLQMLCEWLMRVEFNYSWPTMKLAWNAIHFSDQFCVLIRNFPFSSILRTRAFRCVWLPSNSRGILRRLIHSRFARRPKINHACATLNDFHKLATPPSLEIICLARRKFAFDMSRAPWKEFMNGTSPPPAGNLKSSKYFLNAKILSPQSSLITIKSQPH